VARDFLCGTLLNPFAFYKLMQITLNLRKSVQENANEYFEKAKKSRRKIEGAQKTIERFEAELGKLQQEAIVQQTARKKVPLEWYEKFRWFISSEGFLCIGGRDATSNEVVIKKHTDKNDVVFHTELPGSPFFVIKTDGKKPGEATMQETADATATFSKAWKLGISYAEVFAVAPSQVSKQALTGEYMAKGAFMVTGKRTLFQGKIGLAIGALEIGKVMGGPENAIRAQCKTFFTIIQGKEKPTTCAKFIAKKLNADADSVLRVLPGGACKIK